MMQKKAKKILIKMDEWSQSAGTAGVSTQEAPATIIWQGIVLANQTPANHIPGRLIDNMNDIVLLFR